MRRLAFLLCALLLWLAPARAHDRAVLTLALRLDAQQLDVAFTYPTTHTQTPELLFTADQEPLHLSRLTPRPSPDGKTELVSVTRAWRCLPRTLRVTPALEANERLLLTVFCGGKVVAQEMLTTANPTAMVALTRQESLGQTALRFVSEGLHHIASGPDHILFVVGLLLLGGGLKRLLKIVTAFTLAHSVTLGIAALGWWNPSSQVIEPLIALSIVCVGVENLLARPTEQDFRPLLAFGFGFIHGFGFAGPLVASGLPQGRMALSLLSFNLGVELGQSLIVLACAPLLALLSRRVPATAQRVCTIGSVLVAAAGLFWFVQRVLAG